jgi:spermidine/putrescine transport system ATP-binding protein
VVRQALRSNCVGDHRGQIRRLLGRAAGGRFDWPQPQRLAGRGVRSTSAGAALAGRAATWRSFVDFCRSGDPRYSTMSSDPVSDLNNLAQARRPSDVRHLDTRGADAALPALEIRGMSKRFGSAAVALDGVSLMIRQGEFFTIIGPSGSGKTTLLRIIGGFERPDASDVFRLAGVSIVDVPAHRRNVATVFQHYALFPHMSVGRNVEYGLKLRGVRSSDRRRLALEALELVRLPAFYDRAVGTLSGGERQRVALARVIVTQPTLLLLDEPLGALDEKLRGEMQFELKQLQESLGLTFLYITHNQDEALTMSDRLAILHNGVLQQVGTPQEVYERPQSRFVAEFMGSANFLPGKWVAQSSDGYAEMTLYGARIRGVYTGEEVPQAGQSVWMSVRPEHLTLDDFAVDSPLVGLVTRQAYRGSAMETTIQLGDRLELTVRINPGAAQREVGERVSLRVNPAMSIILAE